ncbi:hypothetical protein [Phenylobacterium sp.]|uniref:hypothetical protein n=1 Tax=Phenylobacterium sp. TaxID=1871053 RepID=UPI0025F2A49D|nr:hypothetical protein [Phenylobacterium sp.]
MSVAVQKTEPLRTETLPPGLPTKLKRPEEKAIRSFKPWMIGADTIGTLLDNGWSLGICCRSCPRTIEMKPEAIEEKFGAYRGLRLIDLLPKLTCGQDRGCGSTDMVLFPWKEPASAAKPKPGKPQSGDLF